MNDPKYITGPIINSATGEAIPDDEPVFLFRARDLHAVTVLEFYKELIGEEDINPRSKEHLQAIDKRLDDFYKFRHENSVRMKQPDTDLARQGTVLSKRNEQTSEEVGRLAARMMQHNDPDVRRLAASTLTQRPDHRG